MFSCQWTTTLRLGKLHFRHQAIHTSIQQHAQLQKSLPGVSNGHAGNKLSTVVVEDIEAASTLLEWRRTDVSRLLRGLRIWPRQTIRPPNVHQHTEVKAILPAGAAGMFADAPAWPC